MAGYWGEQLQRWLGEFLQVPYVRDFSHSAKVFRENSYELSPKLKFLFHVYFDINPNAIQSPLNERPIGLLVRDIKLPSYKFDVKEYNQYNRKRLIQTKINYDPVTITLHDDTASIVTEMWHAYYTYYYADGRKPNPGLGSTARGNLSPLVNGGPVVDVGSLATLPLEAVQQRTQYQNLPPGQTDWGYIGENFKPEPDPVKEPFFRKIVIFGFAQHNFIAYTLVNPIIQEFQHDNYDYDDSNGTMKNNMTINYETVVYNYGAIDGTDPGAIATGFGQEGYYDRENSPITPFGYNGKILGKGGYIDRVGGFVDKFLSGDFLGATIRGGLMTYDIDRRDINFKNQLQNEWNDYLREYYRVASSPYAGRNTNFLIPGPIGARPQTQGQASQNAPGITYNNSAIPLNSIEENLGGLPVGVQVPSPNSGRINNLGGLA